MILALVIALRTNRSSLAIAGVFGAGKTTAISYLLAWLALTTHDTRISVAFRESPAGEAIAQNLDYMHLSKEQLARLTRPVGREHYISDHPHLIDAQANKCTTQAQRARAAICTTGTLHQSAQSFRPVAYNHLRLQTL